MNIIEFYTDKIISKTTSTKRYGDTSFGFTRDIIEVLFGYIWGYKMERNIPHKKPVKYRVTIEAIEDDKQIY